MNQGSESPNHEYTFKLQLTMKITRKDLKCTPDKVEQCVLPEWARSRFKSDISTLPYQPHLNQSLVIDEPLMPITGITCYKLPSLGSSTSVGLPISANLFIAQLYECRLGNQILFKNSLLSFCIYSYDILRTKIKNLVL